MITNKHIEDTIIKLQDERNELLETRENSFDPSIGEYGDYTIPEDERIDEFGNKIYTLLKDFQDELPFEFIIEELTKLGAAPNLLYDDNGHFAISGDGFQPVSLDIKVSDLTISTLITKNQWKPTIREALKHYLSDI